jgi:hypothetical protein
MLGLRRVLVLGVAGLVALSVVSYGVAGSFGGGPDKEKKTKHFEANLDGYQETPAISTTGWGTFRADLVSDDTLHFVFHYEGLTGGNSLFAHVHFGQKSVAGGVSFFLCGGSTNPTACPNTTGTVEGDVKAADVIGPGGQGIAAMEFAEILKAMRAGVAYVNIHTATYPNGEIRGQIDEQKGHGHDDHGHGDHD